MIKAVFFDMDGTLFSHTSGQIPPSARQALQQLRENGIRIFLSTGRCMAELKQMAADDVEFDGYVTINGQCCLDEHRRLLCGNPFDEEMRRQLAEAFALKRFPLVLVEEQRIIINMVSDQVVQAQRSISSPVPDLAEYTGAPIYQATAFLTRQQQPMAEELLSGKFRWTRWSEKVADLIPYEGGKVNGMRVFCDRLGLDQKEVMAFGDAENDIDMLTFAGTGIAMGNALPAVKQIADAVTDDVDHDGIANALRRYHLI